MISFTSTSLLFATVPTDTGVGVGDAAGVGEGTIVGIVVGSGDGDAMGVAVGSGEVLVLVKGSARALV
jgi:hypothetical protein